MFYHISAIHVEIPYKKSLVPEYFKHEITWGMEHMSEHKLHVYFIKTLYTKPEVV